MDEEVERLFIAHNKTVYRYIYWLVKNKETAEDLTQDTFLRVHRARERYDTGRKFSTWIYTIASNLLKNEYRNRSRRRETAFSDLRAEGAAPRPVEFESDAPDPERSAYRGELREAIDNVHLSGAGPFSARCSELLARETGSKRVLLTPSCTAAA